jgi:hypothetical protein
MTLWYVLFTPYIVHVCISLPDFGAEALLSWLQSVDAHSLRDMSVSKNEPEIKLDVVEIPSSIVTSISLIGVHMELQLDPNDDPVRDHGSFESDSRKGQITYTTKQLAGSTSSTVKIDL